MSVGDEGPYMNESGDIWVPRTVPYLEARKVARTGLGDWRERLAYVGKGDATMLGFTRDCQCEEVCELVQRCAACGHDHGDYEGQCWGDGCGCAVHLRPPVGPCAAPAWHFQSEVPMTTPERDIAALKDELRALLEKATPGPWLAFIDSYGEDTWPGSMFITADPQDSQAPLGRDLTQDDAALIVAAVNALPLLLSSPDPVAGDGLRDDPDMPSPLAYAMGLVLHMEAIHGCEHTDEAREYVGLPAAPLSSPVDRDADIARIADAIDESGFGWPTNLGTPRPLSPEAMRRVQAEAVLRLLRHAGLLSSPVEPPPGLRELIEALRVLRAEGRTTLREAAECKRSGFGLGGGSRSGYECTCGRKERQAVVDRALALLPTQASDSKEQP